MSEKEGIKKWRNEFNGKWKIQWNERREEKLNK